MSNINGFHPPSASMAYNGQNETSKRLPSTSSTSSTSSNSTITTNKRLKTKLIVSNVNETRTMKKDKTKKQKLTNESYKKRPIHNDTNNNSTKKIKQSTHSSQHLLSHPILHHHHHHHHHEKKSQLENIPSSTSNKQEQHHHNHHHHHHHHHQQQHHHHHVINNDHCDSCGELYGEMISCDKCPATFHLLCANPPLSREDVPKGSYFCENCRTKAAEEELINKEKQTKINLQTQKTFSYDSKKKLNINGFKKHQQHSTLGQIKLPTASNGRSLIQPSGEIKFRATNKMKSSSSNLKRKRIDLSNSPPSTTTPPIKIPTTQIETLRRLLLSCRPEEFRGPSLPFDDTTYNRDNFFQKNTLTWQKYCFICRKSSINHIPSIHCDYCPLTYHLDCLTPPMTSLPSSTDKWMCPNHIEPILDRYLLKKNQFSTSERVKIYQQYSDIEHNTIIQDFTHMRQTKKYLLTKTIDNHRLERIDISHIPTVIEQYYLNANQKSKQSDENEINYDIQEEEEEDKDEFLQTSIDLDKCSSTYDPCVWDILQAILNHIIDDHIYEFSSIVDSSLLIENDKVRKISQENESNTLDKIDLLLNALNEPNYSIEKNKIHNNGLAVLVAAADSCLINENSLLPTSLMNTLSLLIDLSQFRLSHAALIHIRSKHVIYIRKQVIWFGSSISNDICLKNFNDQQTCPYVNERHACLYYDRKRNLFELLNYSEYGTIVNGLRYGLGNLSDNESDEDDNNNNNNNNNDEKIFENENLKKCFCLTSPSYHSAWDGPAQIEQGTVVQIGCHEFLFYRHVVR
ncbi:unnamed protein product [Rotaria sordida]|uniref:Uncharacterized protein n=2 Tax=Rotaria sordida TaxID=392033 RepID=A0A818W8F0_9BILA|nr:unnamed protein product [Rotaria sordida]CAF1200859.1 unnamed protein product [Rotaria sordida]CAF3721498.1 unnamed protein product [Rotaria sordida]